jgi:signal transduction histidine kinase
MSLSSETTGYLHQEVLKNARYLVVTVDRYGLVARQDCPGSRWRVEGLNTGRKLPEHLDGIIQAASESTAPQLFPYVQLTDDLFADVHVLNRGDEKQLILQDVSDGHGDEYKLQQKAHEVSLLLEQQAELNRELARQREFAEEGSRAKSKFIAAMSHEFRSPITAIMGHAELLSKKLPESNHTATIQRASWHLLTLVENLLDQARTGDGVMHLNVEPVRVREMCADLAELFTVQAKARGLGISFECDTGEVEFETDELRLRQVMINLVSNAIRYTDKGSIEVACSAGENGVRFSVRDTGRGIAEEDRERIFQSFTRLDESGTGAGLGLTISRQIVTALGGQLNVDSQLGKGSTFQFVLPPTVAEQPTGAQDLDGVTVLLVEDDDDLREMYRIFMEDWGMRVTAVPGCREARASFAKEPVMIVMADYSLRDGLGSDLLYEFRSQSPRTGRILCSGTAVSDSDESFSTECADEFLVKPVSAEHLRKTLFRVAEEKHG